MRKVHFHFSWFPAALAGLAVGTGACGGSSSGPDGAPKRTAVGLDTTISGCTDITAPGTYTLGNDIDPSGQSCLHIHDTSDVTLDCAGHRVGGGSNVINAENASNVTISNCTVGAGTAGPGVQLNNVKGGTFSGNDLDWLNVMNSNGVTFTQNHFHFEMLQQSTNGSLVQGNTFDNRSQALDAALYYSSYGHGNQLIGNMMDGGWTGDPHGVNRPPEWAISSTDDGVVISEESQDVVSGNTVTRAWDMAIETVGTVTDSQFVGNQLSNTYTGAIGGWYWSSWSRNTVTGNTATDTGGLFFDFARIGNFRPDSTTSTVDFRDNVFANNVGHLNSQFTVDNAMPWPTDTQYANPGDFRVGNNVLSNNDFGNSLVIAAPWFAVTDGGGNQCGPMAGSLGEALQCGRQSAPQLFDDVPPSDPNFLYIDAMKNDGITHGCTTTTYCAGDPLLREQTAVFIIRALYGDKFPYTTTPYFPDDVPADNPYFSYIQKMKDLGLTDGCTATAFCPTAGVTRGELAVFLIRAKYGANATLDVPATQYFADVPPSDPFYPYIQVARSSEAMPGCSVDNFCSGTPLTRDDVSGFVMRVLRSGG